MEPLLKSQTTSHSLGWLLSKVQKITSVGKILEEKLEPFWFTAGGNINDSHRGKQDGSSQKIKIELSYHTTTPLWGQKNWKHNLKEIHTFIFISNSHNR